MRPRVSVLIPSYGHARFLRRALDSALSQTFEEIEVVVVDDRSPDESLEIARSLDDPRLSVHLNATNRGTYGTLQAALELSRGEFVAVLNSDDFWEPTKLEQQLKLLEKHPEASGCASLGRLVGEQDEPLPADVHADWPREGVVDLLPWLMIENRLLASGVVFRRSGLRFHPRMRTSGDWLALIEASLRGPIAIASEPLVAWRQHGSNSYVRSEGVTSEEIRFRRALLDWGSARSGSPAMRSGLCRNALNLAALYVLIGRRRDALAAVRHACDYDGEDATVRRRRWLVTLPIALARRRLWGGMRMKVEVPSFSAGGEADFFPIG